MGPNVSTRSGVYRTLGEIDGLFAAGTLYLLVKFIRKDLNRLVTLGTFARERLEILVGFKPGTMRWCAHGSRSSGRCRRHFSASRRVHGTL